MKQALAIFRKDARRSRAYIAIVAALTALFAILTPQHQDLYTEQTANLNRAVDLLQMLVLPLTWWLTLAHIVQGEALPGDRQFWITRPYSWRSLLAAKLLFCAAFLVAPFFVADCYIVHAMGFSPTPLVAGLVRREFVIAATVLIPPFLIAALTRSTRQFILTIVGCAVALSFVLPIAMKHPSNYVIQALSPSLPDGFGFALWCVVTVAFLLASYALRRIRLSRIVLVGGAGIAFVFLALPSKAIVPASGPLRHPEIGIAFAPQRGVKGIPQGYRDKVQIDLPLQFTGRTPDLLDWGIASIRIAPQDGGPPMLLPWHYSAVTTRGNSIELYLDDADYDRLRRSPVRIDAVLGVTVYDFVRRVPVPPGESWTEVPGIGFVRIHQPLPWITVEWRTPLRYPAEKLTYRFHGERTAEPTFGGGFGGHPDPQLFHWSPVVTSSHPVGLPNGALLWSADVDVARQVDFFRRDLSIPEVRLSDWVISR